MCNMCRPITFVRYSEEAFQKTTKYIMIYCRKQNFDGPEGTKYTTPRGFMITIRVDRPNC